MAGRGATEMRRPVVVDGLVLTRGDLLKAVWGKAFDGYEYTLYSHINRLRTKIESDPRSPRLIRTVWGVGYRFGDLHSAEPQRIGGTRRGHNPAP